MNERHETLFLNSSRDYVRVGNVWYDANKELLVKEGQNFLLGKVDKVLTYEEYTQQFPESKNEIHPQITDKTLPGGFLRKVVETKNEQGSIDRLVRYAVNPYQIQSTGRNSESTLD